MKKRRMDWAERIYDFGVSRAKKTRVTMSTPGVAKTTALRLRTKFPMAWLVVRARGRYVELVNRRIEESV